ncbi:uncharacterized protein E0L32_011802 [Thyridium curvatum]|uniref:Methyltransferase type 11 domain-containing protein n=1 Tax=Thyridium curvatum TaxID=1093900 RepID=A0A507BHU4_9PEZI|nr:uncharacterized protein E0L32_011802 [Thyridium curvatum]TPX18304.1 hypothetical protein E0L32_011802 [Thyridium curvatum]
MSASASNKPQPGIYSQDEAFWDNYLKGRPRAPDKFFDRIFKYHEEHGGKFDTVHDIGAGIAPYAANLRGKFRHVILSDIAPGNIDIIRPRLGGDGFSYRVSRAEEADDIEPASIDMVFASTMFHFCDQKAAMDAVARQLRPGGTFVCCLIGGAQFEDPALQDLYTRSVQAGSRAHLSKAEDPERLLRVLERAGVMYNVAPLDEEHWVPGAKRIHINLGKEGFPDMVPPGMHLGEPLYTGPNDVESFEYEEGWGFRMGLDQIKEHIQSMAFPKSSELDKLLQDWADAVGTNQVDGCWPCKLILATRR